MTQEERNELKEFITLTMQGANARHEADFKIIDLKLDGVHQRLDKINGSVQKHQIEIDEIKSLRDKRYQQMDDETKMREKSCPQLQRIQNLETDRSIRFSMRQGLIMLITVISLLVGTSYTIIKINEYKQTKEIKVLVEPLQKEINQLKGIK